LCPHHNKVGGGLLGFGFIIVVVVVSASGGPQRRHPKKPLPQLSEERADNIISPAQKKQQDIYYLDQTQP